MRAFIVSASATGAVLALSTASSQAADPTGVWLTADQTARVRVEHCADGYWGTIDWERQPGVDAKNPDPSKRGRPLLGTPILIAMKPSEPNKWAGKVYNPKEGSFYNISISLQSANAQRLEGCMLIFCGGETWSRVADQGRATTGAGGAAQAAPHSACPREAGTATRR
jgi:uncharacterized protein (DUF2147 family)